QSATYRVPNEDGETLAVGFPYFAGSRFSDQSASPIHTRPRPNTAAPESPIACGSGPLRRETSCENIAKTKNDTPMLINRPDQRGNTLARIVPMPKRRTPKPNQTGKSG